MQAGSVEALFSSRPFAGGMRKAFVIENQNQNQNQNNIIATRTNQHGYIRGLMFMEIVPRQGPRVFYFLS